MNVRTLWIALLIGFGAVNVYAIVQSDLAGLLAYLRDMGPWGLLLTTDLLIALGLGIAWMWRDARGRGVAPWPYALLTVAAGSIGLLVYLIRYGRRGHGVPARRGAPGLDAG